MIHVLALAGNGGNAARWSRLPQPLEGSGHDSIVLRSISLPGFDGKPMAHPRPTVHEFAEWLRAEIELVDHPRVFFGTGIGGSIGLQAAQQAGLADAYIFHSPVGPNLDTRLLPKLMKPAPLRKLVKHAIGGPPGRLLLRQRWKETVPASDIDAFAQGYLDCDAFEIMWDILTADWFNSLEPIAEPSVLMWGGEDAVLGSKLAHGFEDVLPSAEVVIKQDWGHYPMLEDPKSFASSIAAVSRKLLA